MNSSHGAELETVASLTTFESTDLTSFRSNLSQAIKATLASIVLSENKNDDAIDTKTTQIHDTFLTSIPWRPLCKAHDKKKIKDLRDDGQSHGHGHSSALEEVCHILSNPIIVPAAYSAPLFMCLLRVLLSKVKKVAARGSNKLSWQASEQVLLQSLLTMVKRVPASAILPTLQTFQSSSLTTKQRLVDPSEKVAQALNADTRLHKYVSVLSYISGNNVWFRCTCVRLFLELAAILDNVDLMRLLQKQIDQNSLLQDSCKNSSATAPQKKKEMCLQCEKRIMPLQLPKMRRRGVSLMALLDDDGGSDEVPSSMDASMIAATNQCRCSHSVRQPLSQTLTQLPFSCVTLRSRAYAESLKLVVLSSRKNANKIDKATVAAFRLFSRRNFGLTIGAVTMLETFLDVVCGNGAAASPSLRLSLLLAADAIGLPKALGHVMRQLWKRVDHSIGNTTTSKVDGYLRIWSELVVESSYFDDARRCWNAMEPLLTRILAYCTDDDDDDDTNKEEKATLYSEVIPLLRSLAYILSRRRPTLKSDSNVMQAQFHDFVTRVSVSFGESCHWITSEMMEAEVADIVRTLQNVGILGLPISSSNALSDNHSRGSNGCYCWPFVAGIRGAHQRMGPHVSRNQLLSEPEDVNELATLLLQALLLDDEEDDAARRKKAAVPIMDYLNDDNLSTVLSYLDPVDLVRVGSLNRTCRALSQEDMRWKHAYCNTYGILGDGVEQVVSKIGSWRNLFVERYYYDKALKFKYNPITGFKHRTCDYVGCYQVMKSPDRQATHYAIHQRRILTKQQRLRLRQQVAEERKVARIAKKKSDALRKKAAKCQKAALDDSAMKKLKTARAAKRKSNVLTVQKEKTAKRQNTTSDETEQFVAVVHV